MIAQVGFSTNLADLLKSSGDDISPLSGVELVGKKVRLLSVMAGAFAPIKGKDHYEYNVVNDIPAAQALANNWPGSIVYSGFEIGLAAAYPAASIDRDYEYVTHHPLKEAYYLYNPPPHNRPTWDLTSVLYGVYPGGRVLRCFVGGHSHSRSKGADGIHGHREWPAPLPDHV